MQQPCPSSKSNLSDRTLFLRKSIWQRDIESKQAGCVCNSSIKSIDGLQSSAIALLTECGLFHSFVLANWYVKVMDGGASPRLLGWRRSQSTVGFLLRLLLVLNVGISVVRGELLDSNERFERCFETVSSWTEAQLHELSSRPQEFSVDRVKLRDLLFFLHIPRTGGRTFHECFLKHLLPFDQRCPRSYDKLRIDRSQPGCRLISTHDDYSLLDKLPANRTSVVTTLRDPVDRVLSSYEFSMEVAARSLRRPSKKSRVPPRRSMTSPPKGGAFMNTLDIWPWKYLVPTMEDDLFARRHARLSADLNETGLSADDSYNAAALAMPLEEFIIHPAAHELVHNGATFQVAGLTNTSFSSDASAIRQCVIKFPRLGKLVVKVAKQRLDRMLYVGLTERQNESTLFFARALGGQISIENLLKSMLTSPAGRKRSMTGVPSGSAPRLQANFTSLDEFTEEEVLEEILGSYKNCVADLRSSQMHRSSMSLEMVKPIKFSREMRKLIPDHVMQKIAAFNTLDAELYAYATVLFQQQQKLLQHGDFHFMKEKKMTRGDIDDTMEGLKDRYGFAYSREHLQALWGLTTLWLFMVLMVLVIVMYVVTKRRSDRVKEF